MREKMAFIFLYKCEKMALYRLKSRWSNLFQLLKLSYKNFSRLIGTRNLNNKYLGFKIKEKETITKQVRNIEATVGERKEVEIRYQILKNI